MATELTDNYIQLMYLILGSQTYITQILAPYDKKLRPEATISRSHISLESCLALTIQFNITRTKIR
jgi:hypothetical protein